MEVSLAVRYDLFSPAPTRIVNSMDFLASMHTISYGLQNSRMNRLRIKLIGGISLEQS